MKILVAGAGALGTWFINFARNIPGVEAWGVVDFDVVESKNLAAQWFEPACLRKNKAQAVVLMARKGWGAANITAYPVKMATNNVYTLIKQYDLVVDCFDNAPSRRLLNDACTDNSISVVHCGIDQNGTVGIIKWDSNYTIDDGPEDAGPTCEDGANLPHHTMVASVLAKIVTVYIDNGKKISTSVFGVRSTLS